MAPLDPLTDLGVATWNTAMKELIETRDKLDASKRKKKKKKKKKKGGLLRSNTSYADGQSEYMDDGCTSAYTSNKDSQDDLFIGILIDYACTNFQNGNKPREFKTDFCKATWMLDKLGVPDYDKVANLDKLVFTIADVIKEAKVQWKTIDLEKMKKITKLCLVRELSMLDNRKDAVKYGLQRCPSFSDFGGEETSVLKSVAGSNYSHSRGSPSPTKNRGSETSVDGIQKGGMSLGGLKSSMKGPAPFSPDFKSTAKTTATTFNLQSVQMSGGKAGGAPTAENLKELNKGKRSASAAPSVKSGGKKGSGSIFGDNQSVKSKHSEPYEEMTVE